MLCVGAGMTRVTIDDDRVVCEECANWRGRCLKGQPMLLSIPQRCIEFNALRNAKDQRTGRERWPEIRGPRP